MSPVVPPAIRLLMIGHSRGMRRMAASPDTRMYSASAASRPFSADSWTSRSAASRLSAASSGNTVALIGLPLDKQFSKSVHCHLLGPVARGG